MRDNIYIVAKKEVPMPKPLPERKTTSETEKSLEAELAKLAALPPEKLLALQTLALIRIADAVEELVDIADAMTGEDDDAADH